jgi:hypothetical protein
VPESGVVVDEAGAVSAGAGLGCEPCGPFDPADVEAVWAYTGIDQHNIAAVVNNDKRIDALM